MKKSLVAAVLAALIVGVCIVPASTAPRPSEVPVNWEMNFSYASPKPIEIKLPGRAKPQIFWYLLYTVTNRTGDEQIFVPEFLLYTDSGQVIRAGRKVPTAVYQRIKKLYNNPLLKDMSGMTGKMLHGEDYAKDGVAIWTDFDPKSGAFDIFAGGLSGETAEIVPPTPIRTEQTDYTGKKTVVVKSKIVLTKTLKLHYSIPGEAAARLYTPVRLVEKAWAMR